MRLFPRTANANARRVVIGRSLRAVADGFISIILPAYLLALGLDAFEVGVVGTATLLGSACLTLVVGFIIGRFGHRGPLLAATALMALTGLGFAGLHALLAAAGSGVRRHPQPVQRRRQRVPADRAIACWRSRSATRTARRCSRITAWPAR